VENELGDRKKKKKNKKGNQGKKKTLKGKRIGNAMAKIRTYRSLARDAP
jgi:hypothetical protein